MQGCHESDRGLTWPMSNVDVTAMDDGVDTVKGWRSLACCSRRWEKGWRNG